MSSFNGSNGKLSQKEREILERQRRLAASLKPAVAAPKAAPLFRPTQSSKTKSAPAIIDLTRPKPKPHSTLKAAPAQLQKRPAKKDPSAARAHSSAVAPTTATAVVRKRPSVHSSSALLTAARKKAAEAASASTSTSTSNSTASASTETDAHLHSHSHEPQKKKSGKPSPKLQRKTLAKSNAPSSLATLVQNISAAETVDPDSYSSLPSVEPDDFWKHMREWDFVSQYNSLIWQQKHPNESAATTTADLGRKPLPDIFLSPNHYKAAWAPLQLAECRAQLMQGAIRNMADPLLVQVKTVASGAYRRGGHNNRNMMKDAPWLEENETGCYVQIRPKHRGQGDGISFMANDLVLLLTGRYKDILRQIQQGTARPPLGNDLDDPTAFKSSGFVGHTEASYRDVNGMTLKISRRKWIQLGSEDMYLVKIGNNVTALREFTALCRVDNLPTRRFILGQHLEDEVHRRKLSRNQSTQQLLEQMGGTQALGAGFIEYARRKFNASQLTAIAASAHEYGEGGFSLIKGPPGTGKTTTLVAVLNSLHIRQYNKYYEKVRQIAAQPTGARQAALELARKAKPRLLVCAPSNAAVDNIILKIMEDGFIDGQGNRYNPSMIRVGRGMGASVRSVALETKVDAIFSENMDIGRLESSIDGYRMELTRITQDIARLRRRVHAIVAASPWPLSRDWEIRIHEETFDETGRVFFVNHKEKTTSYEVPPPPEPGETQFPATAMPEHRSFLSRIVKLVENYFSVKTNLERCTIVKGSLDNGANHFDVRRNLETHVLNSVHMVMTTLGTSGNRILEAADKFEVVVVDEAAQSVEPATLSALQLGSRHCCLVGDPQQLPATIFNISGRNSKYDRSLFQRLEEAGQPVYMLNEQYRMHPMISHFPRNIFYGGNLLDAPNVQKPDYGDPLRSIVCREVPTFKPLIILDLDSREERQGTSLANSSEAQLCVFLYQQLKQVSRGLSSKTKVAIISPYAEQVSLLRRCFTDALGPDFAKFVEINTVDAFQGREANIVIFSAVRAAGSRGVGFLSDVRRMNVALTRAKHFLFVIARCESVVVNPYWQELVEHARERQAVLRIPVLGSGRNVSFGNIKDWVQETPDPTFVPLPRQPVADDYVDPRKRKHAGDDA